MHQYQIKHAPKNYIALNYPRLQTGLLLPLARQRLCRLPSGCSFLVPHEVGFSFHKLQILLDSTSFHSEFNVVLIISTKMVRLLQNLILDRVQDFSDGY